MPEGYRTLFRVAAGPQIGFGHLVRAVSLSRAVGTAPVVSLRGGVLARATARRLGCTLTDRPAGDAISHHTPEVLVVDDPRASAAENWIRAARCRGVPVAAIVDRGLGARGTDLVIDGGPETLLPGDGGERTLRGPRFMVLDPVFLAERCRRPRRAKPRRVVIALGGAHARYATGVADELETVLGPGQVRVAPGFTPSSRDDASSRRAYAGFLGQADVALVAGGVGLYESCCLGVPTVAVAVTPAQRGTIRAFARLGAVVDAGSLSGSSDRASARRLAMRVLRLLDNQSRRRSLAARAGRVVDGRGGVRVAAALRQLANGGSVAAEGRHA